MSHSLIYQCIGIFFLKLSVRTGSLLSQRLTPGQRRRPDEEAQQRFRAGHCGALA